MNIHFHTASYVSRFSRFVIFHSVYWHSVWIWKANNSVIKMFPAMKYDFIHKVWLRSAIKFYRVVQVFAHLFVFHCAFIFFASASLHSESCLDLEFSDDSLCLHRCANFQNINKKTSAKKRKMAKIMNIHNILLEAERPLKSLRQNKFQPYNDKTTKAPIEKPVVHGPIRLDKYWIRLLTAQLLNV